MPRNKNKHRRSSGQVESPRLEAAASPATPSAQQVEPGDQPGPGSSASTAAAAAAAAPPSSPSKSNSSSSGYRLSGASLAESSYAMSLEADARVAQVKAAKEEVEAAYHDILTSRDSELDELRLAVANTLEEQKAMRRDIANGASMQRRLSKEVTDMRAEKERLEKEVATLRLTNDSYKLMEKKIFAENENYKRDLIAAKKQLVALYKKVEEQKEQLVEQVALSETLQNELQAAADAGAENDEQDEGGDAFREHSAAREELEHARSAFADMFPDAPAELPLTQWVEYIRDCKDIPDVSRISIADNPLFEQLGSFKRTIEEELHDTGFDAPPEGELRQAHDRIAFLEAECLSRGAKLREAEYLEFSPITAVDIPFQAPPPPPQEQREKGGQRGSKEGQREEEAAASRPSSHKSSSKPHQEPGEKLTLTNILSAVETHPTITTMDDTRLVLYRPNQSSTSTPPSPTTTSTTPQSTTTPRAKLFAEALHGSSLPAYLHILLALMLTAFVLLMAFYQSEYAVWRAANDATRQRLLFYTSPGQELRWHPASSRLYDLGVWLGVDFTPLGS